VNPVIAFACIVLRVCRLPTFQWLSKEDPMPFPECCNRLLGEMRAGLAAGTPLLRGQRRAMCSKVVDVSVHDGITRIGMTFAR
jgi:hypothetical protein